MQIVINISEQVYNNICVIADIDGSPALKAIKNGTVLPKGHGRLKDIDQILDKLLYMGYMDEQKSEIEDVIELLPILIEADKE